MGIGLFACALEDMMQFGLSVCGYAQWGLANFDFGGNFEF